jgi:hypothetical protein
MWHAQAEGGESQEQGLPGLHSETPFHTHTHKILMNHLIFKKRHIIYLSFLNTLGKGKDSGFFSSLNRTSLWEISFEHSAGIHFQ